MWKSSQLLGKIVVWSTGVRKPGNAGVGVISSLFLKMVVMAALLGAQCCGVSIATDWLVSGKWTSSTDY